MPLPVRLGIGSISGIRRRAVFAAPVLMPRSFPAPVSSLAPGLAAACTAPSVRDWLAASNHHHPLSERTVLELARRIHRWQQHPGGPDHAPELVRRRALRARDQLVLHNLRLISHTWGRHRSSLPPEDEGTADAFQEAAIALVRAAEKYDPSRVSDDRLAGGSLRPPQHAGAGGATGGPAGDLVAYGHRRTGPPLRQGWRGRWCAIAGADRRSTTPGSEPS